MHRLSDRRRQQAQQETQVRRLTSVFLVTRLASTQSDCLPALAD